MKILIAPDKFKGSLSAKQVCHSIHSALKDCDPSFLIKSVPLADGGEGTCDLLTDFTGGEKLHITVHDPLFRKIKSSYGISNDEKTAFIEMASASGLQLLRQSERNPLYTTTLGTGEMIRHALNNLVDTIILGIGGSATNDAGLGVGQALGLEFLSSSDEKLKPIGECLQRVHSIETGRLDPRCAQVQCIILCDVDNPLSGPRGAAFVYAPQKGADESIVKNLDEGLRHMGDLIHRTFRSPIEYAGAGAAGGVSIMLKAIMNAEVRPGMEFISSFTDLEKQVEQADVVITGEGKIDEQTLSGKVICGVARLCKKYGKPLIAVTGKCELDRRGLDNLGIQDFIQLADQDTTDKEAMENASAVLENKIKRCLFPLLSSMKK